MPDQNEIEALEHLLQRAQQSFAVEGGEPFVIVPDNHEVHGLEELLKNPVRKRGNPQFRHSADFCAYVNQQKESATRIYVTSKIQAVAVIDHHGVDGNPAQWGSHRATLNLAHSPEWTRWTGKNNTRLSQREFAQFIEDNSDEIVQPTGADLLDLVRSIKASCSLDCTGDIEEKRGNESGSFVLTTKSKAGAKGDLELPSEFLLALPYYDGEPAVQVRARLRFEVQAPRLILWYELVRIERVESTALDAVAEAIAEATEIKPWHGCP